MFYSKKIWNYRYSNIDDNIYTEDGVLVRRIYVPQVPDEMSLSSLWNNFSEFGKIENIIIKKTQYETYGHITFVNSKDAAKALRLLESEPADTWRQPFTSRKINLNKQNKTEEHVINESESLLLLNDDCLLHIFSFLKIFQLMRLETVCSKFYNLINSISYKQYRIVDLTSIISVKDETLMKKRLVLKRIGNYIKDLTISGYGFEQVQRLIEMVPKYCKNLEIIRFDNFSTFNTKFLSKYLPLFKQLKVLSLANCGISEEMIEKGIETAELIVKLDLSSNYKLTGRCLTKLKNLESLNIAKCENIHSEYFTKICLNNKTLKYLNIENCYSMNGKNFQDIAENLCNLEYLSLSSYYPFCNKNDICKLANLVNLRKIRIKNAYFEDDIYEYYCFDDLMSELSIKNQLESLEIESELKSKNFVNSLQQFTLLKELIINGGDYINDENLCKIASKGILTHLYVNYCKNVSNAGILNCIGLCPNLEVLNVRGCYNINEDIVMQLPAVLKKRNPPKKIIIGVSKHMFNVFIIISGEFLNKNKDLFKLLCYKE